MPKKKEMSRREAVKLAAAAAAFGSVLGYGVSAEAGSGAERADLKVEKMCFKIYRKDILLTTLPLPPNVCGDIMTGNKLLLKHYRNDVLANGADIFSWSWGE